MRLLWSSGRHFVPAAVIRRPEGPSASRRPLTVQRELKRYINTTNRTESHQLKVARPGAATTLNNIIENTEFLYGFYK